MIPCQPTPLLPVLAFILPLSCDSTLLFTYLDILLLLLVVHIPIHSCPWFAINYSPLAASPTPRHPIDQVTYLHRRHQQHQPSCPTQVCACHLSSCICTYDSLFRSYLCSNVQPESQSQAPKLGQPSQTAPVGKGVKAPINISTRRERQDQSTSSMGTGWTSLHQHWPHINSSSTDIFTNIVCKKINHRTL